MPHSSDHRHETQHIKRPLTLYRTEGSQEEGHRMRKGSGKSQDAKYRITYPLDMFGQFLIEEERRGGLLTFCHQEEQKSNPVIQ